MSKTHEIIRRSQLAAMVLSDGRTARLIYFSEPNANFGAAIREGFVSPLGVISLSRSGRLEMEKDEGCTPGLERGTSSGELHPPLGDRSGTAPD